MVRPKPF